MVSTSVANDTIDTAIVVKIPIAASGPPVSQRGITSNPHSRSSVSVATDSRSPPNTHSTGMNHSAADMPE